MTTVVATPGQGPDRPQEVSYSDTKVIGNGSFGVVFQAKLCDTGELVAIKKVLQDKRFKVCAGKFRENIDTNLTSELPTESRATNYETLGALQHREVKVLLLLKRRKGKQRGARFAHFIISIFS